MNIYREEILEHWKNPANFGTMRRPSVVIDQINPLCGDQLRFFFKFERVKEPKSQRSQKRGPMVNGQWQVADVSFTGNGCAISIASASILSEFIKNKSTSALAKITGKDVLDLIGGPVSPARLKCAFLPLEAIRKGLRLSLVDRPGGELRKLKGLREQ